MDISATVVPWNTKFEIPFHHIRHRWHGVPAGVERLHDVPFKQVGERTLLLDLYRPEPIDRPVPIIMWISGGGWQGIDRRGAEKVAAWLCGHGFAMAGIEYRVESDAPFPAQIEDSKAAVRWVRAHGAEYGFDPARIGAWGDSAGGHLVELLGVGANVKELETEAPHLDQSSAVQAVCAFYPPSDMRPYGRGETHAGLFKGSDEERERWMALASPIDHVHGGAPPHLLVHGDADQLVPIEHSQRFFEACRKHGVACTLAAMRGVGHDGRTLYGAEEVKQLVLSFFKRHLKSGKWDSARRQV